MKVDPTCHIRKEAIWLEFKQYVKYGGFVNCTLPKKELQKPTDVFLFWNAEELGHCKGKGFELDYKDFPFGYLNENEHLNVFVWFVENSITVKGNICRDQFIQIVSSNHFSQFVTIPSSLMNGNNNERGSTVCLNLER